MKAKRKKQLMKSDDGGFVVNSAVKQRGRERKGPPIQKFRLRNWPISSGGFPVTPMEGQSIILVLFRRGF